MTNTVSPIAVVGMAARYPGAADLVTLWENILTRRQQFRTMPDVRLPLAEYHDSDPTAADKTYGRQAAVLDGFRFDPTAHRIPRSTYESTDIVHWLALSTSLAALEHARIPPASLPRDTTGVVLGNTLTGEDTRASTMRLRWPFVRKTLRHAWEARGLDAALLGDLETTMEQAYKSVFPPVTEDTLAGGLANTIAGRICNYLDLHGGGYIVDGACSSSLLALATAADQLHLGRLDVALVGGVDVSLDTFELIGFAKATALTRDRMRVYDRRGSGFIPGEGCGMVVLKRLEDARRDGDTVYAVLRGWGIASDGKGGITAPSAVGQARALIRAYRAAGYPPQSLHFVEGHGTGTKVGDRVELEGIARALAEFGPGEEHRVGITSFKSIVGHTKAAAGIGGFIKAALAVHRRVIPPTAGCDEPHPAFGEAARALYPVLQGEQLPREVVVRAGVSAMGFGGINSHVTLESGDPPSAELQPSLDERVLLVSRQQTELFPLAAQDAAGLLAAAEELAARAQGMAIGELADLAAAATLQAAGRPDPPVRAALIASSPEELQERLGQLMARLRAAPLPPDELWRGEGIWVGNGNVPKRLGFLFPGQGSQQIGMARTLVERFPAARALAEQAAGWVETTRLAMGEAPHYAPLPELIWRPTQRDPAGRLGAAWREELTRTEHAQPAICLASLLWLTRLTELGLTPVAVGGHSLGELTALAAAGSLTPEELIRIATVRGLAMAAPADRAGVMAVLACSAATASKLIRDCVVELGCTVANLNAPAQTVISGEPQAVAAVVEAAQAQGIAARNLPVSNAFHSPLVASAAARLRQDRTIPSRPAAPRLPVFSCVGGQPLPEHTELRAHLADQITAPVDFIGLATQLAACCDWLVEVGPARVLTGLMQNQEPRTVRPCLPVEGQPGQDGDLHAVLAEAFARGLELRWERLHEQRLVRPFVAARDRAFFVNPCERPLPRLEVTPQLIRPVIELFASEPADGEEELGELARRVAAALADTAGGQSAALFLHDRREDELVVLYPPGNEIRRAPAQTGIAGEVVRSGAAESIEQLGDDPRYVASFEALDAEPTAAVLYVPLLAVPDGQAVGVVRVCRQGEPFGWLDAKLVGELARAATPALLRAQLAEQLRWARRNERVLAEIAAQTTETSLAGLLQRILEAGRALIGAERGSIFLHDAAAGELYSLLPDAGAEPAAAVRSRPGQVRFPAELGLAGHVLRTRQSVHIANAYADPRFDPAIDRLTGHRTRTIDCVPLVSRGEVIGVLQLLDRKFPGERVQLRELGVRAGALIAHRQLIEELLRAPTRMARGLTSGRSRPRLLLTPHPVSLTVPQLAVPPKEVAAPALEPTPAPRARPEARAVLVELISERTGFPRATIKDQARLLDDLNLDSIKAGALLADAALQLGLAGQVDTAALGGATLGEIVAAFTRAAVPPGAVGVGAATFPDPVESTAPPSPSARNPAADPAEQLRSLIATQTGFDSATLTDELRLLDDLNLDSIKASSLLGELLVRTGTSGRLEAAALTNATLGEITAQVRAARTPSDAAPRPTATPPATTPGVPIGSPRVVPPTARPTRWVRDFITTAVDQPLDLAGELPPRGGAPLLLTEDPADPLVVELARASGGRIISSADFERGGELPRTAPEVVLLLSRPRDHVSAAQAGIEQLALLHRLARQAPARWQGLSAVAFVQRAGLRSVPRWDHPAATSFAASLSLERPELRVRVVDLDPVLEPAAAVPLLRAELAAARAPGCEAVFHDGQGGRRVQQLQPIAPADGTPREITWTSNDVLLVTGGGKGITAACALAFARSTGVRVALVGRSAPPRPDERSELASSLQRFQEAGVCHRYYAADVTERDALARVLEAVRRDLGPVTAVLHGAGTNTPRRIAEVSAAAARLEIAPKLAGAEHLAALLADAPPRLFVAFTSIIGVTGMMNNGWYAYSNEAVDRVLRRFAVEHPETQVACFAFSVWDEVGMGVKLGSVRHLAQLGIDAISPELGVRHFLRWLARRPPDSEVVVAARAAGLATWRRGEPEKEAGGRFAGRVQRFEPGIERVVRVELDVRQDRYLLDHDFRGSLLLPTVFGLEAMAQNVLAVVGEPGWSIRRIEDIRLERPIVVPRERPATIEIRTLVGEREQPGDPLIVDASISTEASDYARPHFAARFVLERLDPKANTGTTGAERTAPPDAPLLDLIPREDCYGSLLFQGPLFQRIDGIERLDEQEVVFRTWASQATLDAPAGLADEVRRPLALGDPYFRDTLLQAAQLVVTPEVCLPVRIARIELVGLPQAGTGRCRARAVVLGRQDRRIIAEVQAFDEQGQLVERLEGYEVQVLERRADWPTPAELLAPERRDQRLLAQEIETRARQVGLQPPAAVKLGQLRGLHDLPREQRRLLERPLLEETIREAVGTSPGVEIDLSVDWLLSGQPVVRATTPAGEEGG